MAKKSPTKTSSVQAHALTELEMRVAVEFFDQAASSYSDHSATEFTLPDTTARRELATAAMRHFERSSGNEAEELDIDGDAIVSHDNVLFHYFARRWGVFVQRLEQGQAIAPPLGAEELVTAASLLEYLSRNDFNEYTTTKDEPDHALPPTPQARQLAEAVIRHKAVRDADQRIALALAGELSVDVHATWLLAYLSARCNALAQSSPGAGHPLDGVYLARQAARSRPVSNPELEIRSNQLPVVTRPGVSPKWMRKWKSDIQYEIKNKDQVLKLWQHNEESLLLYVTQTKSHAHERNPEPFKFHELASCLGSYVPRVCRQIGEDAIVLKRFDPEPLVFSFTVSFFATLMDTIYWARVPPRPETEARRPTRPQALYLMAAQTAALGMILGCKREARLLAKALILAHRLKLFRYAQFYPASQCILQIFASYLERPPLVLKGEAATNPIYKALAVHWRHADGEALAPLLLAVCDEHTHHNARGDAYDYQNDFTGFARYPVEILLVFKLRKELGLANPKLDHPLMNTALGQLPPEVSPKMDDVVAVSIKRARDEGFDEEKVLAELEQMAASEK